ncbi:FAD-dependent oxidoreductase [Neorhizobium sp. NCHU2750]|uniref:FAD-dependent oxidoreductase n=1 Tax=Neorhizobium sp. NCHU2750 TaxID=1825976 RepID=UPI000E73006F|nr:3-oxosteroid 1-dehydrogenase [Neorhizobium sp. NCHU2750]
MTQASSTDHENFDLVVVGSGAAGMTAALTAATGGLKVLVIEKSRWVGGTSAMSGAGTWIPANHHARAEGLDDSPEEAYSYLRGALPEAWRNSDDSLWRAMAYAAGPMLELVEANSPLRFALTGEPDPMIDIPGAKVRGRMLSPKVLSRNLLGPMKRKLRRSTLPHMMTYQEMMDPAPYIHPIRTARKLGVELLRRIFTDSCGQGNALMTGLIRGCLDKGVVIRLDAPAQDLLQNEPSGSVIGVKYRYEGKVRTAVASLGVLLSTGGFEWNKQMFQEHFPGPTDWLTSPDTNSGDGHRMALRAGALLDRMDQANVHPALPTRYEGRMHGLPVAFHSAPHALIVDQTGKRFISEYDYNLGDALNKQTADGEMQHLPAWLIADRRFLSRSMPFLWYALRGKGWMRFAPTITKAAEIAGLDKKTLEATISRFNGFCESGRDLDFKRGENPWERFRSGWKSGDRNPTLGPVTKAPFVVIPMNRSILGTKGGPRTNEHGQVLRPDYTVIAGLYCAGNAMANPIGTRSVAAGTTIGPHMTWGYICARDMVARRTAEA